MSNAQSKASTKFNKENTTSVQLRLNNSTDADIIEHLKTAEPSKMGYIKELIRKDMRRWKPSFLFVFLVLFNN